MEDDEILIARSNGQRFTPDLDSNLGLKLATQFILSGVLRSMA